MDFCRQRPKFSAVGALAGPRGALHDEPRLTLARTPIQVVLRTARETWPMCGIRFLEWLVSGISVVPLRLCIIGRAPSDRLI